MSKIALSGNASGTGTLTIASQNTNSNYTLTIPNETGTLTTTASTPTFTGAVTAPGFIPNSSTVVSNGLYLPAANAVGIATNTTNAVYIDSSQNVGIGTSSPGYKLDVNGAVNIASSSYLQWGGANYWITGSTIMQFGVNGTERARITNGGYFKASDDGTYVGSTGGYHELKTSAQSQASLLVTASNASFDYTGSGLLQVRAARNTTNNTFYAFGYFNTGANANKFLIADSGNATNTNGSYGTISDVKLKQDIVDAGSQWDDIKNLRFRKYRLKSEVELDPNAKPFLGLVAQEAELVSPGLIEEHRDRKQETKTREIPAVLDENGNEVEPAKTEEYTETVDLGTTTKSIKTSILYMKAVKALQEAMTRIEALEAEVAALKGTN